MITLHARALQAEATVNVNGKRVFSKNVGPYAARLVLRGPLNGSPATESVTIEVITPGERDVIGAELDGSSNDGISVFWRRPDDLATQTTEHMDEGAVRACAENLVLSVAEQAVSDIELNASPAQTLASNPAEVCSS